MKDKLIITCAISGAEVTKDHNPSVPYTVEEMVYGAHDKVDALIELLIEKKVFTEKEYAEKLKQILAEYEEE